MQIIDNVSENGKPFENVSSSSSELESLPCFPILNSDVGDNYVVQEMCWDA